MTDAPLPLRPDQVDDLLSAELDGDFDAAAVDLGLDPGDARARLAVTEGVDERRRALGAVRALVAAVPELDEVTAARLRAGAVADSAGERAESQARRRRGRRLGLVGGIAAALLLVVGVVAAVQDSDSDQQVTTAAEAGGQSTLVPASDATLGDASGAPRDLGDFATVDELVARAREGARSPTAASATSDTLARSRDQSGFELYDRNAGAPDNYLKTARNLCPTEARAEIGNAAAAYYGEATVAGRPVVVWSADNNGNPIVVVFDDGCHLMSRDPSTGTG